MDALTPLIEIKNATVKRGETTVFNNLSLELSQHESVAILGPNGAGKQPYSNSSPATFIRSGAKSLLFEFWVKRVAISMVTANSSSASSPMTAGAVFA